MQTIRPAVYTEGVSATKGGRITEPIPVWLPTECIYALWTESLQSFMIFRSGHGVNAVNEISVFDSEKMD